MLELHLGFCWVGQPQDSFWLCGGSSVLHSACVLCPFAPLAVAAAEEPCVLAGVGQTSPGSATLCTPSSVPGSVPVSCMQILSAAVSASLVFTAW